MQNQVISINNYGNIKINIKEYMDKRNMTRYALAKAINARFEVVDKWYRGSVEKIDADVLARLCFVLECNPGDIIIYNPPDMES